MLSRQSSHDAFEANCLLFGVVDAAPQYDVMGQLALQFRGPNKEVGMTFNRQATEVAEATAHVDALPPVALLPYRV